MWAAATAQLASWTLPPAAATCSAWGYVVRLAATAPSPNPPMLLSAQGTPAAPACTPGGPAAFASWGGEEERGIDDQCQALPFPGRLTTARAQRQNLVSRARLGVGGGSHADMRAGMALPDTQEQLQQAGGGAGGQWQAGGDARSQRDAPTPHPNARTEGLVSQLRNRNP